METGAHSSFLSLAGLLAERAGRTPDAPALLTANRQWNWRNLASETAARAASIARRGLPRDSILALAGDSAELALAALACSWAGYAFLPLDAAGFAARRARFEALADGRLVLLDSDAMTPTQAADRPPPADVSPAATALLIATSGSEGEPKLVMLSHVGLLAAARGSNAVLRVDGSRSQDTSRWLGCLPLTHIGGQSILWRCLEAGVPLNLHERFDAARVWADITAGSISHVSLVPAMLAGLLDAANGEPPPRLQCALLGGAALSAPLHERARRAGWPLWASYGMSETGAMITALPPEADWHEGLVGRPLPGVEIRIAEAGRIAIRTPQLMRGYLDPQGFVGIGLDDGWLISGDVGELDAEGRLVVHGRGDEVLVSGGVNVHPQEIESAIAACPGVTDVAVTATPDPVWGDFLAALLVGPAEPQTVYEWCQQHLPSAQRPRRFLRVDSIPRNAMGKLNRRALRALFTGSSQ